jgi:uncharacterized protein YkwD
MRSRIVVVACVTLALAAGDQAGWAAPASTSSEGGGDDRIRRMEHEVLRRVNGLRQEHGLAPLESHRVLAEVARQYSCRMARQKFFGHEAPGGETLADRLHEAGQSFRVVGENLAANVNATDPVAAAVHGWMKSPGHRQNLMRSNFTKTGVGICRARSGYYFTQVFVRPRA